MIEKCSCGGTFRKIDGLEGMFCDKCDEFTDREPDKDCFDIGTIYSEDRLKSIRGVPHTTISLGSETKGRLQIMIPAYCTESERKYIINTNIDSLEYALATVKERGLDIFSARKGGAKE